MTTATKILTGVVLCLLALAYFEGRSAGAAKAEAKSLRVLNDSLRSEGKLLGEKFRVDTVRLTRMLSRSDTVIQQLVDTAHVYHTDTVKVPVEVLVREEQTLRACRETVSDCTLGWQNEKKLNLNLEEQLKSLKKAEPSVVSVWIWRVAALELGRLSAGRLP